MKSFHRGVVTITLLLLLSSFLLLTMLFNDDLLRLYSSIASQRNLYVTQQLELQRLSQMTARERCEQLSLEESGDTYLLQFSPDTQQFPDGIRYYAWCQRDKLFQKSPVRRLHEGTFDQFISEHDLNIFREQLQSPPSSIPRNQPTALYWFTENETEWELNNNVNAVIVAEGNLHVSGVGKISGSIITKGKLTLDEDVKVTYSKNNVTRVVQQYSRWRLAEKSRYDFSVTEN